MNKKEFIDALNEEFDLGTKKATEIVNWFLETIKEECKKGGEVKFYKFGTFKPVERKKIKMKALNGKEFIKGGYKTIKFKTSVRF